MPDELDQVIQWHASKGLLIDTNLLLLYLVGLYDRELIYKFKRTRQYDTDDYEFVHGFIARFPHVVLTPHVITEVSNLSGALPDEPRRSFCSIAVGVLRASKEKNISKDVILDSEHLPRFGFTDVSILEATKRFGCVVLTDDRSLTELLLGAERWVVNLNYIRTRRWFSS